MTRKILPKMLAVVGLAGVPYSDMMLGAAGIGIAGGVGTFALVMIANTGQMPSLNGAEHLKIFSQPVTKPYKGAQQALVTREEGAPGLDFTPIGTVRLRPPARPDERAALELARAQQGPPAPTTPPLSGYRMRGIFQSEALVQGPSGFQMVRAGSEIEGAGRVTAIEARGRRWVVVTTTGYIEGD